MTDAGKNLSKSDIDLEIVQYIKSCPHIYAVYFLSINALYFFKNDNLITKNK